MQAYPINPTKYISNEFLNRCREAKVKRLGIHDVVTCKSNDSISDVMAKLIAHKILSVPIFEVEKKQFVGFLHMLDILSYIVATLREPMFSSPNFTLEQIMTQERFKRDTVKDITHVSRQSKWVTINQDTSVFDTITTFAFQRLREAAIVNENGEFVSLITQFRLLQWISNKSAEFGDFGNMTIEQFRLGFKNVFCMHKSRRVIDVLLQIHALDISAIGIIDDDFRLIGNISVSDLKDIGDKGQNFPILWLNAGTFINNKDYGADIPKLVYTTPDATVKSILKKFYSFGVHRIYIVDSNTFIPLGVISCTDIIAFFYVALSGAAGNLPAKE